ncbi:MAG: CarD family transcriptional regulator, partial [Micrococcales bacterium]
MRFEVGETVVYPHHGAAEIIEKAMRTVRGETKAYLQLKVAQSELTIWVPEENVEMVGVRDVIDKKGVEQV